MIERAAQARLIKLAKTFRSVAVVGPRQSGKTTLCRNVFPNKPYVSLENPDVLQYATQDPRGFLAQYKNGAILDEVQRLPILFSYLQQILDDTKKQGLFILTGSNNFLLQNNITQSLAGRIAYLELLPLTIQELSNAKKISPNFQTAIHKGFYPECATKKINPNDWFPNYVNTYVERDVRQLKNIGNLSLFNKFLRLCAARTGQLLNLSSLGNDCGIDQKTAAAWLSILQSSYIVYVLRPYYNNYNKRLIKAPKLYFYDVGLAASLLQLNSAQDVLTHYSKGALFENLVIIEKLKQRFNAGLQDNMYFWRDKIGREIDLLLDASNSVEAIEIKAGETLAKDFTTHLAYYASVEQKKVTQTIVYGGKQAYTNYFDTNVLNWKSI